MTFSRRVIIIAVKNFANALPLAFIMIGVANFQTCRAACPPYVVPAFRHKQCMNPASLQFRLSLSRAILSMRISVHYRARRGEWRKTILSRKLICAVILFKHKQLRPRVRTLII